MTTDTNVTGKKQYDSQSMVDTFVRYKSNPLLFHVMLDVFRRQRAKRIVEIGFSGRYGLILACASEIIAINNSNHQIAIGHKLIETFLPICLSAPTSSTSLQDKLEDAIAAMIKECSMADRAEIARQITEQDRVIKEHYHAVAFHPSTRVTSPSAEMPPKKTDIVLAIDVTPHFSSIADFVSAISSHMTKGGTCVFTYFPSHPLDRHDGALALFARAMERWNIEQDAYYDKNKKRLKPAEGLSAIKVKFQELPPDERISLVREYWLDLPFFQLHSRAQVERALAARELKMVDHIEAPGGMLRCSRSIVIARK